MEILFYSGVITRPKPDGIGNSVDLDQAFKSSLIWVCMVCLALFCFST